MKIYILDNASRGIRYNRQWVDHVPKMLIEWGFDIEIVSVTVSLNLDLSAFEKIESSKLMEKMVAYIINDKVTDDDVILFPDARDFFVLPIADLLRQRGLKTKLVGFWSDGMYYTYGDLRRKTDKLYRKQQKYFERALTGVYDYNLITDDTQFEYFKKEFRSRTDDKARRCDYPFGYLVENFKDYPKEDMIIYNAGAKSNANMDAFDIVKNHFPEYNFVICHTENFVEEEYFRILKRAKVLFNTNTSESSPYSIFESLVFGVLPIVPDFSVYDEMFPKIAKYNKKMLDPPYITFVRNREQVFDPLKEYINDYEKYRDEIVKPTVKHAHENYYNENKFKKLLCSIQK